MDLLITIFIIMARLAVKAEMTLLVAYLTDGINPR
jgi:hypothetical protein